MKFCTLITEVVADSETDHIRGNTYKIKRLLTKSGPKLHITLHKGHIYVGAFDIREKLPSTSIDPISAAVEIPDDIVALAQLLHDTQQKLNAKKAEIAELMRI